MIIDAYQDMTLKEIQKSFNKTPQAVTNGVKRMIERTGRNDWKIKNGRSTIIKAAGVEWLANYFHLDMSLTTMDEEREHLRAEIKRLSDLLEQERNNTKKLEETLKRGFEIELEANKKVFLLETKEKDNQIKLLEDDKHFLETSNQRMEQEIEKLKNRNLFERIIKKYE